MPHSATFDVLGTCFHFQPAIDHIAGLLARVPSLPSDQFTASALFHSWFYAAQRDFTYLSLTTTYTPIISIFRSTFRRALHIAGFPSVQTTISESDIDELMSIMAALPPRDGLKECFEILRGDGWDVSVATNGGRKGTEGYFGLAGVEGVNGSAVLSCDEIEGGVAKPDGRVYDAVNEILDGRVGVRNGGGGDGDGDGGEGQGSGGTRWFVAAHSWDLIAARKAGFRTAWVGHEEGDACEGVFGRFDVVGDGLVEVARGMVEFERKRGEKSGR